MSMVKKKKKKKKIIIIIIILNFIYGQYTIDNKDTHWKIMHALISYVRTSGMGRQVGRFRPYRAAYRSAMSHRKRASWEKFELKDKPDTIVIFLRHKKI